MKKYLIIIIAVCTMPLVSCGALLVETSMNLFSESMDIFGDMLDELGDDLDDFGDDLEELGDDLEDFNDIFETNENKTTCYYKGFAGNRRKSKVEINNNDKMIIRKFKIDNYHALEVGHIFYVVMCDTVDSVTVHINEKLDKNLNVKVSNGTLVVTLDRIANLKAKDNAKCGYIYLPYNVNLNSFRLSGSASFVTKHPINANEVSVDLSGVSVFKAKIMCKNFSADLSGSSRCRADITCEVANVDLSGISEMESNLLCNSLVADLSGSSTMKGNFGVGSTEINEKIRGTISISSGTIRASLSGTSSIELAGKCSEAKIELSGSSTLKCKKLKAVSIEGSMSGTSKAMLYCSEHLAMELGGCSNLTYYGNPRTDIESSRSATVIKK